MGFICLEKDIVSVVVQPAKTLSFLHEPAPINKTDPNTKNATILFILKRLVLRCTMLKQEKNVKSWQMAESMTLSPLFLPRPIQEEK